MDIANAVGIAVSMAVFYMAYILFMDHVYTEEKQKNMKGAVAEKAVLYAEGGNINCIV